MPKHRTWTIEDLERMVPNCFSFRQVALALGLSPNGGGIYIAIKRAIKENNIDISHFKGQGWNTDGKGLKKPVPLDSILIKNSKYTSTFHLKKRLIKEGLKEHKCEICGLTKWNNKDIPIELDHVNGIRDDNRIDNLRILCPNCHAQTENYCGKNIGNA